jgi:8-oxo-dGTP pyrophosphatase MutT (NUDIX family)
MPNGNIVEPFYVLEYPDLVGVVAITPANEIILVKQYRHGINKVVLELPCGSIESTDKTPMDAAKRELLEETGYSGDNFVPLCKLCPNPSNQSNYIYSFLALNVKLTSNQHLDYSEDIESIAIPIQEVKRMINKNEILQTLHVPALFYAFNYLDSVK